MRFLCQISFLLISPLFFAQDYAAGTIPDQLMANANAVVRLDELQVNVESQRFMEVNATRVVTVLNENGRRFVEAYLSYDKETKIKSLEAYAYDSWGREIEHYKEKDFADQSAIGNGTIYSDNRVKYLPYSSTSFPYTIVFHTRYTTSDTGFMPNWYFLDGFGVSTQKSKITYNIPEAIPYRVQENNLEAFGVEKEVSPGKISFSGANIPAIKRESYSPRFKGLVPNIYISLNKFHLKGVDGEARDWKEFGAWIFHSLLANQDVLSEQTKTTVMNLIAGIDDPREKVRKIYEYVQNNTRYISVQLGIGGWQPISAQEVDRVKYGDCKGLTNYTMALLKIAGIQSYYTVVYADSKMYSLSPDFASIQGNHVFLNVPLEGGEELWLECTSQRAPMDYLGTFTDNRYVLKVTPDGGELVKSRKYLDTENTQITEGIIVIDPMGSVSSEMTIVSSGIQYDQKYELSFQDESDLEEHYKEYWDYVNDIKIKDVVLSNDKKKISIAEHVKVKAASYISVAGNNWIFAPNMFNRFQRVPKRLKNRERDIVVKRGFLDEDDFTIELPTGVKAESLLPTVHMDNEFGEYKLEMTQISDSSIRYKRRLMIRSGIFPKEKYEAFRDFHKKVAMHDNSKLLLIKT